MKPSRNDMEEAREQLTASMFVAGEEDLHENKLRMLDDHLEQLVMIHQETQTFCSKLTQAENSTTNFTKAKNLSPIPDQQVSCLAVPSLFEFLENVKKIQTEQGIFGPSGALHKTLVDKMLESLWKHEEVACQDIKNGGNDDSVKSVVLYLVEHFGSPPMIESLAQRKHEEIGRLLRPFVESNAAVNHAAIRAHRSAMNSVTSMINYYTDNFTESQAYSLVSQGGWTNSYQKTILSILPWDDVSGTVLMLKHQTPKEQYQTLKNKIENLTAEIGELVSRYNQAPIPQTSLLAERTALVSEVRTNPRRDDAEEVRPRERRVREIRVDRSREPKYKRFEEPRTATGTDRTAGMRSSLLFQIAWELFISVKIACRSRVKLDPF